MRGVARVLTCLLVGVAAASAAEPEPSRHWPQWRGPEGQGVSSDVRSSRHLESVEERRLEDRAPRPRPLLPDRLGRPRLPDHRDRGRRRARRQGGQAHRSRARSSCIPTASGADRKHAFKVLALDAASGRILWERTACEGTPYDSRHKKASFASPTPVDGRRARLRLFRLRGPVRVRLRRQARVEVRARRDRDAGRGRSGPRPCSTSDLVIVQCDEDSGEKSFIAAFDSTDGQGGLARRRARSR